MHNLQKKNSSYHRCRGAIAGLVKDLLHIDVLPRPTARAWRPDKAVQPQGKTLRIQLIYLMLLYHYTYLSINLAIYPIIYLSICLSTIVLSIHLHPSTYLSTYINIYLSISIYLSQAYMSAHMCINMHLSDFLLKVDIDLGLQDPREKEGQQKLPGSSGTNRVTPFSCFGWCRWLSQWVNCEAT